MDADRKVKRQLMLEAAFQVFDASLDTDSLFEEACSLSKKFKVNGGDEVSVEKILSATVSNAQNSGSNLPTKSLLSTPWLAKQVKALASQCDGRSSSLCPDSIQECWIACLDLVEKSMRQGIFIPNLFLSILSQNALALEMMWDLHAINAFDLLKYLTSRMADSSMSQQLVSNLLKLCQGSEMNASRRATVLTGCVGVLIRGCFEEANAPDVTKVLLKIIDCFLAGFIRLQMESDESLICPFGEILKGQLSESTRKRCITHALFQCLQHDANTRISESVSCVKASNSVTSKTLLQLFKQLLAPLEVQNALELLAKYLECDQVNTEMTFTFISALLSVDERNASVLKEHIRSKLVASLQSTDAHQTAVAFFMARLGSCVKSLFFYPSYRDWYQGTFGDAATSPASNRVLFSFLMKCMRDWVPQESAEFLKAHILRKPFIPSRMKDMYDSYVLLAKTRLSDLKIPVNDQWFENTADGFHKSNENQSSLSDSVMNEVESAIKSYSETSKVPTSILEASIFRKPYFVGKFLPMLLKPRCLPDLPDSKMKLIEEVWKSGRIAGGMYTQYLENCEKERQALLEGVFDLDDDAEDEMILQPIDQLQFQLDRLKNAVLGEGREKIYEIQSLVQERIQALLSSTVSEKENFEVIKVDLKASTGKIEEQIISKILQTLTQVVSSARENKASRDRGFIHNSWFTHLIKNIIGYTSLRPALISFIINCLKKKKTPEGLSPDSLAVVCLCLRCLIVAIQVTGEEEHGTSSQVQCSPCDIVKLAFDNLIHASGQDMLFSFRFWVMYIVEVLQYFEDIRKQIDDSDILMEVEECMLSETQLLPDFLVRKVQLLFWRLRMLLKSSASGDKSSFAYKTVEESLPVFKSSTWLKRAKKCSPTFAEWVKFELGIDPSPDCLSPRLKHTHYWAQTGEFAKAMGTSTVCSQLYTLLAENRPSNSRRTPFAPQESVWMDFWTLLKNLLLHLPPVVSDELWLLSLLSTSDAWQRSSLMRLIPRLPPFLLLSNAPKDRLTNKNLTDALAILDLLAVSDLNEGAYLSLEMTIAVGQACKDHHLERNADGNLTPVLSHPLVFCSMLMHRDSLECLGIFKNLPDEWLSLFACAGANVQSDKSLPKSFNEVPICQAWMEGAAIFTHIVQRPEESTLSMSCILDCSSECQLYALEYFLVLFYYNMLQLEQPSGWKAIFCNVLSRSPQLLEDLLSDGNIQLTQLRKNLGIPESSKHLRIFCLMRIMRETSGRPLTPSVISAYITLLQRAHQDMEVYAKMSLEDLNSLSSWLREMVDRCGGKQSVSGMDLAALRKYDPLLYRHIRLHLEK